MESEIDKNHRLPRDDKSPLVVKTWNCDVGQGGERIRLPFTLYGHLSSCQNGLRARKPESRFHFLCQVKQFELIRGTISIPMPTNKSSTKGGKFLLHRFGHKAKAVEQSKQPALCEFEGSERCDAPAQGKPVRPQSWYAFSTRMLMRGMSSRGLQEDVEVYPDEVDATRAARLPAHSLACFRRHAGVHPTHRAPNSRRVRFEGCSPCPAIHHRRCAWR